MVDWRRTSKASPAQWCCGVDRDIWVVLSLLLSPVLFSTPFPPGPGPSPFWALLVPSFLLLSQIYIQRRKGKETGGWAGREGVKNKTGNKKAEKTKDITRAARNIGAGAFGRLRPSPMTAIPGRRGYSTIGWEAGRGNGYQRGGGGAAGGAPAAGGAARPGGGGVFWGGGGGGGGGGEGGGGGGGKGGRGENGV